MLLVILDIMHAIFINWLTIGTMYPILLYMVIKVFYLLKQHFV